MTASGSNAAPQPVASATRGPSKSGQLNDRRARLDSRRRLPVHHRPRGCNRKLQQAAVEFSAGLPIGIRRHCALPYQDLHRWLRVRTPRDVHRRGAAAAARRRLYRESAGLQRQKTCRGHRATPIFPAGPGQGWQRRLSSEGWSPPTISSPRAADEIAPVRLSGYFHSKMEVCATPRGTDRRDQLPMDGMARTVHGSRGRTARGPGAEGVRGGGRGAHL